MIETLIEKSKSGTSAVESSALLKEELSRADIKAAKEYALAHSDYSSYYLLLVLRKQGPKVYGGIPETRRAEILCSALGHLRHLNDWGYLAPDGSHDGQAATALLETGKAALDCLKDLLDNEESAPLFGSEDATMSYRYRYRRCDFAYRYISLIMGRKPGFSPDPAERDKDIGALKRELRRDNS